MSVKEVTALRKSGNLDEAFKMASQELQQDPGNPWTQMSVFWVLRDLCMQVYIPNHDMAKYQEALARMKELLPTMMDDRGLGETALAKVIRCACPHADEITAASDLSKTDEVAAYQKVQAYILQPSEVDSSLHESLGWILYKYLKKENQQLTSLNIRKLLRDYMHLKNERPSMLHSSIISFALNFSKGHSDFNFYRFFLMWGPSCLSPDDFCEGQINGKPIPSLISRICRVIVESGEEIDLEEMCKGINDRKEDILEHLRESYFWHFMNMHKEGRTHDFFEGVGTYAARYSSYGPSHWHSEILKLAERFMNDQEAFRFLYFFKTWDYANLMPDDWKETTDEKGNTYKSLALKSAKKCFAAMKGTQDKNKELIEWLVGLYQIAIRKSHDEWTIRELAMLHCWLGDYPSAISLYKELLLQMSDKFYIWSELSQCIEQDNELKVALLCKSLTLERDEKFLGDIHLHLAEILIQTGDLSEAATELAVYKENREKESWQLSPQYQKLVDRIGPMTNAVKDNRSFYRKNVSVAEAYAFADIESHTFVLVDKQQHEGKTRCFFTDGKQMSFQISAKRFDGLMKAKPGSCYSFKCIESTDNRDVKNARHQVRYIPLCMKTIDEEPWGSLPIHYGYISYINTEKKIITVLTPDSTTVLHTYTDKEEYKKGSFITFREYETGFGKDKKHRMAQIRRCKSSEALEQYPSAIVAIDSVNPSKSLFHYVSKVDGVEGVVFFKDTSLRPKEGELFQLHYCFRKDKEGNRRCEPLSFNPYPGECKELVREVWGDLEVISSYKGDYGFVDDCYVSTKLVRQMDGFERDDVNGIAVYTGNGKWKVIRWCGDE